MTKLIQAVLIVSLMTIGASSQTIKVLKTTNNIEHFKDGSGAKLRNVHDFELVDFTVCFRFFFFAYRDTFNILISSKREDTLPSLSMLRVIFEVLDTKSNDKPMIWSGLLNDWNHTFIPWPAMEWHHICLSYENNSSIITVVSLSLIHI